MGKDRRTKLEDFEDVERGLDDHTPMSKAGRFTSRKRSSPTRGEDRKTIRQQSEPTRGAGPILPMGPGARQHMRTEHC